MLEEYFKEALLNNEYLKITTKNNKVIIIKVERYNHDKLFYYFKDSNKNGSIYLLNICNIEFYDSKKQKDFIKKRSKLPNNINEYFDYYINCLKKIDDKENGELKIELFNAIFESLYNENNYNLLVRYFSRDIEQKKNDKNNNFLLLSKSNNSQREAIRNALNNNISIIQGPPGTGKTTTILSLISNFIIENKSVVVVSKNNSAVDNIVEEFQKMDLPEFYLRFGKKKIMDDLFREINKKQYNLEESLNKIYINSESLQKLNILRDELEILEEQVDELISLKNLIFELKTQKKFIDKKSKIYKFKEYLTEEETKIICDKHANIKTIDKLINLSNKNKYNFFEKLIIKYKYCIKQGDIKLKLNLLNQLLEEFYINREIAIKEEKLLNGNLEGKQNRVKNIYDEYTELCMNNFKSYLKQNININSKNIKNKKEMIKLAFNTYPLILTTADGFLFNFKDIMDLGEKIDCVIIDEASQCDVITGLPLLYLAKKIVVVGDSKQLSAITNVEVETNIPDCYKYTNNNFLQSIKSIFNPPEKTLEEHYRCDYNIINFCNKYYYDNRLKIYSPLNNNSMSIINADKCKGAEKIGKAIINKREVKTLKETIDRCDDFFVITPFRGQADLLVNEYDEKRAGSIHCFQGKGADKVYFSTVLNELDFCNKHIKSDYNMFTNELVNVAVSRAKHQFILVTDKKYFENNSKYVTNIKNLIDYIGIYGNKIDDKSSCIFDYLYKNIKYYKSNSIFDNEYEEKLFNSINEIIKNSYYICYAKFKLINLVQNKKFLDEYPEIKQYIINGAHADFTIIDSRINKPILVIELDGKYHEQEKQKLHDDYKDRALLASDISILRIKSKEAYDINDLKNELLKYIFL